MGNDNTVEIAFKTTSDGSGADAAAASIRKVTGAVKDSKSELEAQEKAWEAQNKEIVDLAGKTDTLSVSKKNLLANLKALRHEIPGLNTVISLLKNPYTALAVAAAWAMNAIRNYTKAVEEAAQAQRLEQATFRDINALQKLTKEYETSSDAFKKQLAEVGQATPVDKFQKWAEQMTTLVALQNQLTEKTLEHSKLLVKQDLLTGKITPQQAEEKLRDLTGAAKTETSERSQRALQDRYATLGFIGIPGAEKAVAAAAAGIPTDEALGKAGLNAKNLGETRDQKLKTYDEQIAGLRKQAEDIRALGSGVALGGSPAAMTGSPQSYKDRAREVETQADALVAERQRLVDAAFKAEQDSKRLQDQRKEAEAKLTQATQQLASLREEHAKLEFELKQKAPLQKQIEAADQQNTAQETRNKITEQGQERDKRIKELHQKVATGKGTPEDLAELGRLQGESAAANTPAPPPRPPNISPAFAAVAAERGYYVDPTKNALGNNQAIAQNIASAVELAFQDLNKEVKSALAAAVRRITKQETRSEFGISDE